jgi:hypothetical protein
MKRRYLFSVVGALMGGMLGLTGCDTPLPLEGERAYVDRVADDLEPGSLRPVIRDLAPDTPINVILPPGEHLLTRCGPPDDSGLTGDLDLRMNAQVTLYGEGARPVVIRQTCEGERVVDQLGTGRLRLFNVVITGGSQRGTDPAEPAAGGGVRAAGAVELANARVAGNRVTGADGRPGAAPGGAALGGGIAAAGDVVFSRSSSIVDNTATGGAGGREATNVATGAAAAVGGRASGGGIATPGRVEVASGGFQGNRAVGGPGSSPPTSGGEGFAGAAGGDAWGGAVSATTLVARYGGFESNRAEGGDTRFTVSPTGTPAGHPGGAAEGGAVAVTGAVTIESVTFRGNQASEGAGASGSRARGGALFAGGQADLKDVRFESNQALGRSGGVRSRFGGAVFGGAAVTLERVTADANLSEQGGAVRATGPLTVTASRLSNNRALRGGAISAGAEVTITGSSLEANHLNNRSEARGAGVFANGAVIVESSSFSQNRIDDRDTEAFTAPCGSGACAGPVDASVRGGAIRSDVSITATKSTFAANRAEGGMIDAARPGRDRDARGGALSAPDVRLDNVTLDGNSSVQYRGTGPFVHEPGPAAAIDAIAAHLSAVTLTGSSGAAAIGATTLDVRASAIGGTERGRPECGAGITVSSGGANRFDDGSCGPAGAGDRVVADLGLLPLSDYGGGVMDVGGTMTRLPAPDSPVIDAVPAGHPACSGVDQRGVDRPGGPACDAGAVEAQPVDFGSDLSVFVEQSAITVGAGGTGTFTVTVRNSGTKPASAMLDVATPPGIEPDWFAPQPGGAECGGGGGGMTCMWGDGEIEPGGSRTDVFTVYAAVSGAEPSSSIRLTAITTGADPDPEDNHAEVAVTITALADLAISVGRDESAATGEGETSFAVRVRNNGPAVAATSVQRPIRVRVQLAFGVVFLKESVNSEPRGCTVDGQMLECSVGGLLPVGEEALVRLTVSVPRPVPPVIATATITDTGSSNSRTTNDPDASNNRAEARPVDVATSTSRPAGPVPIGQDLPVEVVVTNNGPNPAPEVVWHAFELPVDEIAAAVPDTGSVTVTELLEWRIPRLAAGATARLRLTVRTVAAEVLYGVVDTSAIDVEQANNMATVDLRPAPEGYADLAFDPPTITPAGEAQLVRVVLRNAGPAPMIVNDGHPLLFIASEPNAVGPIVVSTSAPGWTCPARPQTCTGGQTLAAGATVVFDVLVGSAQRPVDRLFLQVFRGATAESDLANNERWVEMRTTPP